jgi:two-component system invasion response regulator UvrY
LINVIICDDHSMIRRGIRDTLAEGAGITVTGEASNYSEVKDLLRTTPCEVLILDLNLPGRSGLEVLESLPASHPHVRALIVSMFAEDQYAIRCLKAGAFGYLNKAGDPAELIKAVQTVATGKKYITPAVSEMLIDNLASPTSEALHNTLSDRELQTLMKIAAGKRLSDIASELMLSPKTVSVYRARLLSKLNLHNNAELAVYAIRNQLI